VGVVFYKWAWFPVMFQEAGGQEEAAGEAGRTAAETGGAGHRQGQLGLCLCSLFLTLVVCSLGLAQVMDQLNNRTLTFTRCVHCNI